MSKERIERELAKSLLEKKLLNMSQDKVDDYFDEVKTGIKSQHPFRNHPLISNLYNKDGLYLEKNYGNAEWAEMSRRVKTLNHNLNNDKKDKRLKELNSEIKNLQNEIKIERETRQMGGLLQDDRYGYKYGGPGIEALRKEAPEVVKRMGYAEGEEVVTADKRYNAFIDKEIQMLEKYGKPYFESSFGGAKEGRQLLNDLKTVRREMDDNKSDEDLQNLITSRFKDAGLDYNFRFQKAEGGDVDEQMSMLMGPTHTMPDGTVMPGATHEEGEMMMKESEEPEMEMESDSEMEDNYLDFIIDEALSEEEEDMLMSKLEQDEELSMLFDKVIEVASEFAGSGPVEGPGTGVSDSIPARLSDGEFVFTAKAVEEIGADNLMAMMKEAEMKADERQGMANGGMPEDEEENVVVEPTTPDIPTQVVRVERPSVGLQAAAQEQQDLVGDEIKKRMMDPSTQARYVRS